MFIDESGLSQRPHRCRTWSPKGQTPVLQYSFNWKTLSAVAGITWWNFYFQLHPGSIRSPQVVEFLTHLKRHIKKRLMVIWDRSKPHRSRMVKDFVAKQNGAIRLEYLPAYAPELNPVEYLWGYWTHHELPKFLSQDFYRVELPCPKSPQAHAPPPQTHHGFLETSGIVLSYQWSLYYPNINS